MLTYYFQNVINIKKIRIYFFISQVLNLLVLDDNLPELAESFQITLVSAESGDGKPGSTPTSGASIDPNSSVNTVTVTASDHPYGIDHLTIGKRLF